LNIEVNTANIRFFEALSSETRIRIIEMLNIRPMNIKDMAKQLGISSGIVTRHINILEAAGIVKSEASAGKRGMQKICILDIDYMMLLFRYKEKSEDHYTFSIPIGQYSSFNVRPTCGLASSSKIIGAVDDSRYFADPEHVNASHLWFACGYVDYCIPNYLLSN
jgi:predicted transcriptional regulator